ncbi:MAG: proteasome subunit beta [Candidatus Micrarchaeales archaeon]|jgi:proteasome beta subunit
MERKEISDAIMKGTTTIALICSDGVVIGADTRATMDTFIASSEAIKVFKIDDHLGMTIAGAVGDANYLVKVLKTQNEFYKMNENKPMSPGAAASLLSLILQENKFTPFYVGLIIAGLNKATPEVYGIDYAGGSIKESKFTSIGSGSIAALGYLESIYTPSLNAIEGVKHVAKALQIAMKRDAATGDGMKLISITKKGFKEYSKEEMDKILK